MAGTGVKLRVETDDERVRAALGRLVRTLDNPKPVMDEIGAHLESSTVRRFEAERGPNGRAWKPSKRARKQGGKTLSDTGRLCASITRRASRREVAVGTNVLYAAIHQFGGKIEKQARSQTLAFRARGSGFASRRSTRRRKGVVRVAFASIGAHAVEMPARPFLGVDDKDPDAILDIVRDRVESALA